MNRRLIGAGREGGGGSGWGRGGWRHAGLRGREEEEGAAVSVVCPITLPPNHSPVHLRADALVCDRADQHGASFLHIPSLSLSLSLSLSYSTLWNGGRPLLPGCLTVPSFCPPHPLITHLTLLCTLCPSL